MLRRTRITLYGKRRQLPKLRHSDHSRDIGSYHIRTSPSWTFPLLLRTFSFSLAPIWMRYRSIWGRNMTFTSRNARVWVLLWWNGLVGLSFICKRLLIVESLVVIGCDCRILLIYLMYVCKRGINLVTWNQRIPPSLHLCVRHLQCEYSEQFLDRGKVLELRNSLSVPSSWL